MNFIKNNFILSIQITDANQGLVEKPSFKEAFWFWLKLGFVSFGGPAGQIAIMHEFLVDKKKWISDSRFLHALNYTMILPGPEAQQLATYTGWLIHGAKGGLVAGIFFILPSMFILMGLSALYVTFGTIPWVYALFNGLKPAVIAIVILALIKIGKKSLYTSLHIGIAIVAFIGIFFFAIPFPVIIIGSLVLAFLARKFVPQLLKQNASAQAQMAQDENQYYINENSVVAGSGFKWGRLLKQVAIAFCIWILPFVAFYLFTSDFPFWKDLTLFFTKAAFVTFGGAYAVLPYVAQVSVEQLGWLTEFQMIDGLALGETTPGPLVMVLVFVGFMAGFNHSGGSLLMGSMGLMVTTLYTFVPCFLLIFVGAPIIERTRDNETIKQALSIVTAAVVGVILNLTIYLSRAVIFPKELAWAQIDFVTLGWIVVSFIAMYRFKINMMVWIGVSALFGLVHHLIG
ncbi:chromate efflux transporter [Crocinitomicaceae bacterium]|nr:chromate efflux transporter [Crocinitomicaceae bacterium]